MQDFSSHKYPMVALCFVLSGLQGLRAVSSVVAPLNQHNRPALN